MKIISPNQLDKSRPGTWPIYYQLLIWGFVLVIVIFLYSRFIREDLVITQQNNEGEISTLKSEYKKLYQFNVDLPLYENRKMELIEKLTSLLEFLPVETEMPNLIDEIYQSAYKNNINFTRFAPQASIVKEYYNIEPITLSTSTGFGNFVNFVQYIGQLSRILNVKQFNIVIDAKNNDLLDITSNLETYIYNKNINELIGEQVGSK